MAALSPAVWAMFLVSAVLQVVGILLMPATRGLTAPLPTIGFALCYIVAIGLLPRIVHAGVDLGLLIPALSAVIPLIAVMIGALVYHESVSLARVALLGLACLTVGFAATK